MAILPWNAQAAKNNGGRWVNPDYDSTTSTFGKINQGLLDSFGVSSSGSGSSLSGAIGSAADAIGMMSSIADANSARSANEARIQREWQEQQNAKAMEFNADQAAINRNWQQMMSNTAHQREVADLKAAGLNPVLSAMNGNGAAVTSGATASGVTSAGAKGEVDMSMNSALVSLLASIYNRTTQIEVANINARTQEAVADKYNATSEIVAQIGALTSKYAADSSYAASKYSADRNDYRALYEFMNTLFSDASSSSGVLSSARDAWNNFNHKTVALENKVKNWSDRSGLTYVLGEIKNLFKRK